MRICRYLFRSTALIFVACLFVATAAAQTYWVQSADYGSGNRRQDVTQIVRQLVSGPSFRVNNQTLGGDPYVGADKTLRIVGRDSQGNVRDFRYGEGATVNSSMFRAQQWGGGGWNGGGNNGQGQWWVQAADYGSGDRRQDVTQTVRRLVNGSNFRVNNQTLGGDPYVGADKTLRITGRDDQGNVREFKYGEGATVNTSMFRGQQWNGGGKPGWNGGGGGSGWNNTLSITSAQWGSGSRYQNVTQRLQNMIRNNRISVLVNPKNLGDPTPGASKQLRVTYQWQGRTMNTTRVEGEMLNLP